MTKVFSFDIFDTVLVRKVAISSDVIRLAAERLAQHVCLPDQQERFVETFLSARDLAYARAHAASGTEDCTIEAIWGELARLMPGQVRTEDCAIEIACDEEQLLPNPTIAKRIHSLRAAGHRVIFISDIYYRRETLFRWLSRFGLCSDENEIYASSEVGLLKHSGRLFDHVLACEGIPAAQLHHLGDNRGSDYIQPRRRGINAEHYPDTRLNAAERAVLDTPGAGMAASRMAAAMRLARLQDGASRHGDEVTAFLGPLGVLIAVWTANLACTTGVKRIYFIARDGYVPWRAAMSLPTVMQGIDVRYVRLSRGSLIAAIPHLGEFGAFWIRQSWSDLSAREIVERLGYLWQEVEPGLDASQVKISPDAPLSDDRAIFALVSAIDGAELSDARRKELDERRANVVGYLRQEGMFDGMPFMVFDVGWFLNLQAAFKSILDAHGATGFVEGSYFALSLHRVMEAIAGPARAMFYEQTWCLDRPDSANFVFDRRILVEHLLGLAPHGSATGYACGADGRYLATEGSISAARKAATQDISDRIARFASLADDVLPSEMSNAQTTAMAEILLRHFVAQAHNYDLDRLTQLYAETDGKQSAAHSVAEPWRMTTVLMQIVPYRWRQRFNLGHGPTLWPEMAEARAGIGALITLRTIRRARQFAALVLRKRR